GLPPAAVLRAHAPGGRGVARRPVPVDVRQPRAGSLSKRRLSSARSRLAPRNVARPAEVGLGACPVSAETLSELLRTAAREAPDAEAFRYRDERLTYRDWDGLADRVA